MTGVNLINTDHTRLWQMHPMTVTHLSSSQDQKSWTLYKIYWRLANGILMGILRSKSRGVYGGGGPNEWFI